MKNVCVLITFGISMLSFAQVGIKTDKPYPSADLELGSNDKTLILNRVLNTSAIANPVDGMMIYDRSEECVKAYQNKKWSKCLGKGLNSRSAISSISLSCSSATISPAPTSGKTYKGTLTIPYTGGNGSSYESQIVKTNGLSAVLPAGMFSQGSGNLQYSVTGTPDQTGNITFNVNVVGNTCSVASR
ncbi:hypothetical protein C1637_02105 [Chryseobacterium lactis]|uniref:Uncharacterized protein n=2 Tax=Chryseobacterium lactis TaxID=1241981 RepID=A0A3G6RN56_CHRLC|nr:hypothetical protein EG342_05495 [Chryseobacterium lactis]AZB06391.1 hypothetical protein EG341_21620 [Chryseobacterium lactis]PNW15242.1 hypothetical protein C1637_02105 [Chryseobacterium lactis]